MKTVEILKAKVIINVGAADTVILTLDKPSAIPALTHDPLSVKFLAAEGTGAEYVKEEFGIESQVIKNK